MITIFFRPVVRRLRSFRTLHSLPLPLLLVARSAKFLKLSSLTCLALSSARLCTCLFILRSGSNQGLIILALLVAEGVVRVRVRGRIVTVQRKRRQVRVVGVIATAKTTHRRDSAAALSFFLKNSTSPPSATPIRMCCRRMAWISVFQSQQHHGSYRESALRRGFVGALSGHLSFRFRLRSPYVPFVAWACVSDFSHRQPHDNRCRRRSSRAHSRAHCYRTT